MTDTANNNNDGNCDVVAVAVYNTASLQVQLPPIFLLVVIPYVGASTATKASTVPIKTIVGGQTSNSEISHDEQDSNTVQPQND